MIDGDKSNNIVVACNFDRCLRERTTWTECSLCVDTCPSEALSFDKTSRHPLHDPFRCIKCGLCLASCPLEVFESSGFSERQLLDRIKRTQPVTLACFLPRRITPTDSIDTTHYQLGTCLAALTPGALFDLALTQTCTLETCRCEQCTLLPFASETLGWNATLAQWYLRDFNASQNLRETTSTFLPDSSQDDLCESKLSSQLQEDNKQQSDDNNNVALLHANLRTLFAGKRKALGSPRRLLAAKMKEQRVPSWRVRIMSRWIHNEKPSKDVCPWPFLQVNIAKCRACGMCMQLCPTGSIRLYMDKEELAYMLVPGTCTNCGMCISSCQVGALSRTYQPFEKPFDEQACFREPAKTCSRCNLPVFTYRNKSHCELCSSEPDPKDLTRKIKEQLLRPDRNFQE